MKKIKKRVKMGQKFFSVFVLVALLAGGFQFTSSAEENIILLDAAGDTEVEVLEAILVDNPDISVGITPYTMLADCIISVVCESDGMHIDISTGAVGTASVLGIKDVKIYKKTWYGGWDLVAVSPGGEAYDQINMGISLLYENAVKGAKYKITCIHYGNVDGYIEGENDSGEFTFTY